MAVPDVKRYTKALYRRAYWGSSFLAKKLGFSIVYFDQLSFRGLSISRLTPENHIANLLLRLKPVSNGFDLIRIGNDGDGGYLLPNDFVGVNFCFSAGCDLAWTFEKNLDEKFQIASEILDSIEKKPKDLGPKQNYTAAWLGINDGRKTISFDSWLEKSVSSTETDMILQIDIEGFEWQILNDITESQLARFRTIVIEFHNLDNLKNYGLFKRIYRPALSKLLNSFNVVHFHPNNCCGESTFGLSKFPRVFEVTLHNKNRGNQNELARIIPNNLDKKNVMENDDLIVDWKLLEVESLKK
jgi:hypothetical protein